MLLKEQLMSDLKSAMKEKDTVKKNVVTMVRAAILQVEKDNKVELGNEEVMEIISKQVKQRKDALEDFKKGGREDLVELTNHELELLLAYLPEQLSTAELTAIVKEAVERMNITQMKQMGQVMGDVMPKVKGRADGKAINEIVKQLLS